MTGGEGQARSERERRPCHTPRRVLICLVCGRQMVGQASKLYCGTGCRTRAHRLRKAHERRRLERLISHLVAAGRYEEARREAEAAWPPSLRAGLLRHFRAEVNRRERFQRLMDAFEERFAQALERGLGFPSRHTRTRIPPREEG